MNLPTGSTINLEDIKQICQIIRFVVNNSQEITKHLPSIGDEGNA